MKKLQWAIYAAVLILGVCLGIILQSLFIPRPLRPPARASTARLTHSQSHVPPWGILEALEIPLADPDEFFADRAARLQAPGWFFENFSESQVIDFLKSCSLTDQQLLLLTRHSKWQLATNGLFVSPSPSLVQSLSAHSRALLYNQLAVSEANYAQRFPFRFARAELDSRLAACSLSSAKLAAIRNLTYTNAGDYCFADLELLPDLLNKEEFGRVIDCLYRLPAYRLRLRVYNDSNIDQLAEYWGRGGRIKKIRPLLESLSRVRQTNGVSVNVSYFLPSFARLRLYTFPHSWKDPQTGKEDCFWTSLNFFNEQPDMQFLDSAVVRKFLQTEYAPIHDHPVFGDIVTLVDDAGNGLHACVYLADDFVFTKNGINQLAPWVLMKIPDMLRFFPMEGQKKLVILRRKELPPEETNSSPPHADIQRAAAN